jgi:hypothetical protein
MEHNERGKLVSAVLKKAISKPKPKNGHRGTGYYWYVVLKKAVSKP